MPSIKCYLSGASCLCSVFEAGGQAGRSDIWHGCWQALWPRQWQARSWSRGGGREGSGSRAGFHRSDTASRATQRGAQRKAMWVGLLASRACSSENGPVRSPGPQRGEGALEDHLAQTSTHDKHGRSPTVLPGELLGDVSSSKWVGPFLGKSRALGLLWHPQAFKKGSLDLTERSSFVHSSAERSTQKPGFPRINRVRCCQLFQQQPEIR